MAQVEDNNDEDYVDTYLVQLKKNFTQELIDDGFEPEHVHEIID